MAFYKINMFFSQGKQGWSDTYYADAASPDACFQGCRAGMLLRCNLITQPAQVEAIRISDEEIYRDSSLFELGATTYFGFSDQPDAPWTAYLLRMENAGIYWRNLYLRGIPDAMWSINPDGPQATIRAQWFQLLSQFMDELKKTNTIWRLKCLDKGAGHALQQLGGAVAEGTEFTDWNIGSSVGFQPLDSISFLNTGLHPAPGRQIVFAIPDPTHVRTMYRPGGDDYTGLKDSAKWRKNAYIYVPPTFLTPRNVVHRISGRPFGQQRGRRPA